MSNEVFRSVLPNAAQMDARNSILNRIADKLGAYETPLSWGALQAQIRAGAAALVLQPGDQLSVGINNTTFDFDVQGIDEDEPVNEALHHVLTIQSHNIFSYNEFPFDPQQYLYSVQASEWPDGLPAGKYKVTLDHATYSGGTGQDGTYVFTTTQVVPVGGGIRHTTIGAYQSGSYTKSQITGGTFITYAADTLTTIETSLITTEYNVSTDTDAVLLGTTTGNNPAYKVGDYINFAPRNSSGGNRWSTSWIRQYLNSDDAEFTFVPATIWSRNVAGTFEGFLHALDPEVRAVLCKVRTRYALSLPDNNGYEDVEDYVKLDTILDIFGTLNNSIYEGPVDRDGTVTRTTQYSLWKQLNANADRIKYEDSTARAWWMSSPTPTSSCLECRVSTAGASSYVSAGAITTGVVPSLFIG